MEAPDNHNASCLTETSLGHLPTPGAKWAFDDDVTHCFDDMLRRSIPQYDVMRDTCCRLASHYRQLNTDIVDLGCSRGEAMAPLVKQFQGENRFIGVEVSQPMREACIARFASAAEKRLRVEVLNCDLRHEYPPVSASVTLAVLVVQFTPIEYRAKILRNIFNHTLPGGALVFVEKVLGPTAELDDVLVAQYYALKRENGYSQEEIDRKRFSLEGVLVPITAEWNESLLENAGFTTVECFWRWMNFAGWLAVK